MLKHPHIDKIKREIRGRDPNWKRTMVVMTSLTLHPADEEYDRQAETELLSVVTAYWQTNPTTIDAVNIRCSR